MTARPKSIIGMMSRVDDLYLLHNAYERGFYAGVVSGAAWGRGTVTFDTALKPPRSPFSRLMKHYERHIKRFRKQR